MAKQNYSRQQLEQWVKEACSQFGFPLEVARALIQKESGWNPNARGKNTNGTYDEGIMQINNKYRSSYGVNDPYNAKQSIFGAISVLARNYKTYKGDLHKTLAAYNAGVGAVNNAVKKGRHPDSVTTGGNYAQSILKAAGHVNNKITGAAANMASNNQPVNLGVQNMQYDNNIPYTDPREVTRYLQSLGYSQQDINQILANQQQYTEQAGQLSRTELGKQMRYLDTPIQVGIDQNTGKPIMSTPRQMQQLREQQIIQADTDRYNAALNQLNPNSEQAQAVNNSMYERLQAANNTAMERYMNAFQGNYYMDPNVQAANIMSAVNRGEIPRYQGEAMVSQMRYEADIANKAGIPFEQFKQLQQQALSGDRQSAQLIQQLMQKQIGNQGTAQTQARELYQAASGVTKAQLENARKEAELQNQLVTTLGPKVAETYIEEAKQRGLTLQQLLDYQKSTDTNVMAGAREAINANQQSAIQARGQNLGYEGNIYKADRGYQGVTDAANINAQNRLDVEQMKENSPEAGAKVLYYTGQAVNPGGLDPNANKVFMESVNPQLRNTYLPGYEQAQANQPQLKQPPRDGGMYARLKKLNQ